MSHLTLTLDDQLLQRAQTYARQTGRSLEQYIEALLRQTLPPPEQSGAEAIPASPQVAKLYGAISLPPDFDYKEEVTAALREKYGL